MNRRGRVAGGASSMRNAIMHQMPHSMIKSVQSATINLNAATSNTATITAVDPANSLLFFLGQDQNSGGGSPGITRTRLALTNSTTVTCTRGSSAAGVTNTTFLVVEFWPGVIRQVQRGSITIAASGSSGTGTISPALQTVSKAFVVELGWESTSTNANFLNQKIKVVLTDTTTVTASRQGTTDAYTVGYQVVEFL